MRWKTPTRRVLERIEEEIELTREEVRLSRQSRDDLRDYIREQTLRMERAADLQARESADMRDQLRANTAATWRMLDRLDNGGTATA